MKTMKTKRNKSVPVNEAIWLTVTADENEITVTGYNDECAAKDLLDKKFQRALPEELTLEYLENMRDSMKECMDEGQYVDRDDFEEISKKYWDAKNRSFDYDDAYTDGSFACYMPKNQFGMIGNVYKRTDVDGRYIVFWHDESEVYREGFETEEAAQAKMREVFTSAIPKEALKRPGFLEKIEKMTVDENDMGIMGDTAFCIIPNYVFSAVIENIA